MAPEDAWRRIKFRARKKRQIGVLIAVAAWREREARSRNVPRNRVIKDDAIIELAIQQPGDRNALKRLRALAKGHANSNIGVELLAAVRDGLAMNPASLPDIEDGKLTQPEGTSAAAEVLKLALKVIAEREGIAPKLIASSSDVEKIAAGELRNVPAMHGWRRKVFGDIALEIKDGNLALGLKDKQAAIIPLAEALSKLKAAE